MSADWRFAAYRVGQELVERNCGRAHEQVPIPLSSFWMQRIASGILREARIYRERPACARTKPLCDEPKPSPTVISPFLFTALVALGLADGRMIAQDAILRSTVERAIANVTTIENSFCRCRPRLGERYNE